MNKIENQYREEKNMMVYLAKKNIEKFDLKTFALNFKKAVDKAIKEPEYSLISVILLRIISLI